MNGVRSKEEGLGLFALSKDEKMANSSKGGIKGGERMKDYIWITDGETNTRIPIGFPIPDGWINAVTRKKKAAVKIKPYGSVENWNKLQKEKGLKLLQERHQK
jgi:hypothetical protein